MLHSLRRYFTVFFLVSLIWVSRAHAQLATYIGSGGTSTAVTGYPNETVTALQYINFGTNTACGSGGRSGITVSTTWNTYNPVAASPRLYIKILPNPGYALNMTGFSANLRASGTGPTCARFAYSLNSGATWVDDATCHPTNTGAGCSVGVTSSWGVGALPTGITNTVDGIMIAIFPYAPGAGTGTFQVNRIDIAGAVVLGCTPPAAMAPSVSVCSGQTIAISNTVAGGTWSTSNSSVATIVGGTITGGASGQAVITYANGCAPASSSTVTVNPLPNAGALSGNTVVCVGSSVPLSSSAVGGLWSSSNAAIATVTATGVVWGANAGVSIISYSNTTVCGTAVATQTVMVNPLPAAGVISGNTVVCVASSSQLSSTVSGGCLVCQ